MDEILVALTLTLASGLLITDEVERVRGCVAEVRKYTQRNVNRVTNSKSEQQQRRRQSKAEKREGEGERDPRT